MFITLFSTSGLLKSLFFSVVRLAKSHLFFPSQSLWNLSVPHFPLLGAYYNLSHIAISLLFIHYLYPGLTLSAISLFLVSLCTVAPGFPPQNVGDPAVGTCRLRTSLPDEYLISLSLLYELPRL